jgi:hypothetical protein
LKGDTIQVVKIVISKDRNCQVMENTRIVLDSFFNGQIHHISMIANNTAHELVLRLLYNICDIVLLEQSALFL